MDKKTYINPELKVVRIAAAYLLAGSEVGIGGETNETPQAPGSLFLDELD